MHILEKTAKNEARRTHGGREVLRITTITPAGDCAAALHLRALADAFAQYAEREYFPAAKEALDAAVAAGKGYTFAPQRCEFSAKCTQSARGIEVEVSILCRAGDRVLLAKEFPLFFDAEGLYQLPARRAKAPKKPRQKLPKSETNRKF